jgi:hypothetical protein
MRHVTGSSFPFFCQPFFCQPFFCLHTPAATREASRHSAFVAFVSFVVGTYRGRTRRPKSRMTFTGTGQAARISDSRAGATSSGTDIATFPGS